MSSISDGVFLAEQVLHYAYRLCEIALRILTLLLVTEALRSGGDPTSADPLLQVIDGFTATWIRLYYI